MKFNKKLPRSYFRLPPGQPQEVLCIERQEKYRPSLEKLGFSTLFEDIFHVKDWPRADVYVACNVLEHFNTVEHSMHVVRKMLEASDVGAWFILPSFQQDTQTGEGVLRKHGLRFNWTSWIGHPSHFCVGHVYEAIRHFDRSYSVRVTPSRTLVDNQHPNIVPDLWREDIGQYDPKEHGPKPLVKFDPPIVAEWSVEVRWDG